MRVKSSYVRATVIIYDSVHRRRHVATGERAGAGAAAPEICDLLQIAPPPEKSNRHHEF